MKKIFTTVVMAAIAMTSFAQSTQEYYRVEFTVPIVGSNTGTKSRSLPQTSQKTCSFFISLPQ